MSTNPGTYHRTPDGWRIAVIDDWIRDRVEIHVGRDVTGGRIELLTLDDDGYLVREEVNPAEYHDDRPPLLSVPRDALTAIVDALGAHGVGFTPGQLYADVTSEEARADAYAEALAIERGRVDRILSHALHPSRGTDHPYPATDGETPPRDGRETL